MCDGDLTKLYGKKIYVRGGMPLFGGHHMGYLKHVDGEYFTIDGGDYKDDPSTKALRKIEGIYCDDGTYVAKPDTWNG